MRARTSSAAAAVTFALVAAGAASASGAAAGSATAAPGASTATSGTHITWLAIGDSVSSGLGLSPVEDSPSSWGRDCYRATTGVNVAWPVQAARALSKDGVKVDQQVTACSGTVTDDWAREVAEAYQRAGVSVSTPTTDSGAPVESSPLVREIAGLAASGKRWNLLTLSFGANNIDSGAFVEGCADIGISGGRDLDWGGPGWGGCDVTRETIQAQIDALVGRAPAKGMVNGTVPLVAAKTGDGNSGLMPLYDSLARFVEPGGVVLIVGYPQLVESPERTVASELWKIPEHLLASVGNCSGISYSDIPTVRWAFSQLNAGIKEAVESADQNWAPRGVRFRFVDTAQAVFESDRGRHALCSQDPWIGDTSQLSTGGAMHPNARGHAALGQAVAHELSTLLRESR
ncbi:MAG: GDSL-type esterase/lipase family protein [Dermatophilus congolensis]|nr:GDSL-type esterase/lipase family protein [Dermatophilus congolensis]